MQTIKSIARGRWPDQAPQRFSWYEPIDDPGGRPGRPVGARPPRLFLNTSSDARLLPATIEAATR